MEDSIWLNTYQNQFAFHHKVLILVVMEDSIWHEILSYQLGGEPVEVLILVVMEDSIWQFYCFVVASSSEGLNPCCNGR